MFLARRHQVQGQGRSQSRSQSRSQDAQQTGTPKPIVVYKVPASNSHGTMVKLRYTKITSPNDIPRSLPASKVPQIAMGVIIVIRRFRR